MTLTGKRMKNAGFIFTVRKDSKIEGKEVMGYMKTKKK